MAGKMSAPPGWGSRTRAEHLSGGQARPRFAEGDLRMISEIRLSGPVPCAIAVAADKVSRLAHNLVACGSGLCFPHLRFVADIDRRGVFDGRMDH